MAYDLAVHQPGLCMARREKRRNQTQVSACLGRPAVNLLCFRSESAWQADKLKVPTPQSWMHARVKSLARQRRRTLSRSLEPRSLLDGGFRDTNEMCFLSPRLEELDKRELRTDGTQAKGSPAAILATSRRTGRTWKSVSGTMRHQDWYRVCPPR